MAEINGVECKTVGEMLIYKLDRTLAIVGVIVLGIWAMTAKDIPPAATQITTVAIGGLVTYIGGRTGK